MNKAFRGAVYGGTSAGNGEEIGKRPSPRIFTIVAQALPTGGWPAELLAEVAAAPTRRCAAALVVLSQDAVDALPCDIREALLAALQDALAELPA